MKCSCQIEIDHEEDYEESEVMIFEKDLTICENQQRCCECGVELTEGDQYRKEIALHDYEAHTYRTCLDCISIRDNLFCGWTWTCLLDDLREEIEWDGGISESCMAALTIPARGKVCEMIEEHWERNYEMQD